jgi:hypothetical protein
MTGLKVSVVPPAHQYLTVGVRLRMLAVGADDCMIGREPRVGGSCSWCASPDGQSSAIGVRLDVTIRTSSSLASGSVIDRARSGALEYGDGASEPCDDPF